MEMRELRKTNQQLEKLWDEGKNLIEIQVEYKFYSVKANQQCDISSPLRYVHRNTREKS